MVTRNIEKEIFRGDRVVYRHVTTDNDGNPVDITGSTLYFTIKTSRSDPDGSALHQTAATNTNPTRGISEFTLTTAQTGSLTAGNYFFDTSLVYGNNSETITDGRYVVNEDITDFPVSGSGDGTGSLLTGTLAGLTDTSVSGESSGDLIIWDGTDSWDNKTVGGDATISAEGSLLLADDVVSDAELNTSNSTGDGLVLAWEDSGSTLKWISTAGTISEISDIPDVEITSVADGELFSYDSSSGSWINKTLSEAGVGTVSGPGSGTDNAIVRWDGTGGSTTQDSGVLVSDSDDLSVPAGSKVVFDGGGGDTYFVYNSSSGKVELYVDGNLVAGWG